MTERGTLKELNVKPGDVVRLHVDGTATVVVYTIAGFIHGDYRTDRDEILINDGNWGIVSRASAASVIDLTVNTSAYGLCGDAWRAALLEHVDAGGKVEWYCADGNWYPRARRDVFWGRNIYRAKLDPVVTTLVQNAWAQLRGDKTVSVYRNKPMSDNDTTGTLTTTLHDGKPVKAEWVAK